MTSTPEPAASVAAFADERLLGAHEARWLDAQDHSGVNVGDTSTHALFVELKEPGDERRGRLGPTWS